MKNMIYYYSLIYTSYSKFNTLNKVNTLWPYQILTINSIALQLFKVKHKINKLYQISTRMNDYKYPTLVRR